MRSQGLRATARRAAALAHHRLGGDAAELPLDRADVADSTRLELPAPVTRPSRGSSLTLGWICTPPALGSGGHTTMFRMVTALEAAGHRCVVYLYDRHGGQLSAQTAIIRRGWPEVRAEIRDIGLGMNGLDACVATGWESAHVLASRGTKPMRRLYFIQDFEPYFYPRGSEYALARDSYKFGFRCIALGGMVEQCLREQVGISSDRLDFGCDTSVYHLVDAAPRERAGVVFYARPGNARRGYWLARLALEEFHERHREVPIYVYGSPARDLPFPVEVFPTLTPGELNLLYNRSYAGIAMSFTNISLVAEELLAAGAVPVVNDADETRADLSNPHVAWAAPTPGAIAEALSRAVSAGVRGESEPAVLSASVRGGWSSTQSELVRIVEDEIYERQ